jgi:ATP-binding cassette subfamily F protein uup
VISYLGDFLFPPERVESPVRMLSGGERNRLLLAMLFARPANVLVMDEPTNDLDLESLELLETTLQEYPGTVLLVSHDRRFLDSVVTQTLVAEGGGRWREHAGGYSDWLEQRPAAAAEPSPQPSPAPAGEGARRAGEGPGEGKPTKLSYKESRELAELPGLIESLEQEQRELLERMSRPDYHALGADRLREDRARLPEIEQQLEAAFERWAGLEARSSAARPG